MHMADALLSPAVAGTMYVASAAVAGLSVYKLKKEEKTTRPFSLVQSLNRV